MFEWFTCEFQICLTGHKEKKLYVILYANCCIVIPVRKKHAFDIRACRVKGLTPTQSQVLNI